MTIRMAFPIPEVLSNLDMQGALGAVLDLFGNKANTLERLVLFYDSHSRIGRAGLW